MKKYTQKALRELVKLGLAEDITNYDFFHMNDFLHAHILEKVGY